MCPNLSTALHYWTWIKNHILQGGDHGVSTTWKWANFVYISIYEWYRHRMALGKTNVILDIFDTLLGILDKISLPLYLYWRIYTGKLNGCSALQYNKQEEGPRMALGYIDCFRERTNWCSSHSWVSRGKVWLRRCRGVKRYRVPPSPSELVSVYNSGWGIVISQEINFFYPLLRNVCVSIYKTSIRVFAHSWLNCQISRGIPVVK